MTELSDAATSGIPLNTDKTLVVLALLASPDLACTATVNPWPSVPFEVVSTLVSEAWLAACLAAVGVVAEGALSPCVLVLSEDTWVLLPGKFAAESPGVGGAGIPEDGPSVPPPGLFPGND